jgi:pimeloyl-ACP methyl ester carboxylesterase
MKGTIKYKGANVHYNATGKGNAVVLIHGFMEDQSIWDKFVKGLSEDFFVITVDLPGHGQSEVAGPIHTMDMFAIAVNRVLQALEVYHCVMIGHSMGGYVTLAYARKYPGKLRGFGLFHSHAGADTPEQKLNRSRTIDIVENDRAGFILNFFPSLFAPMNVEKYGKQIDKMTEKALELKKDGIIAALDGMKIRVNSIDVITFSKVPVLFIVGKQDSRIPAKTILDQVILPPQSEVHIFDNVGHMGFIEARKETLAAIKHFVEKIY